jgi:hypothetical protein
MPVNVIYCPPFSDNMDGEKEEIVGIRIDCKEKEDEYCDPTKLHDTACRPGCKAENGKVHST